jgi:hypothetical protein
MELIVAILGVVIAILVWLFPPEPVRKFLKFSSRKDKELGSMSFLIRLGSSSKDYWTTREGSLNLSMIPPFQENCSQFFQIDTHKFVDDVDPSFDITLINESHKTVFIHKLGVEIVSVAHHMMGYGQAQAAKIVPQASYTVKIPDVREIVNKDFGGFSRLLKPTNINLLIPAQMPDPFRLEPESGFRYEILLEKYVENMPNLAVIRFWIETQEMNYNSDYIYIFTL